MDPGPPADGSELAALRERLVEAYAAGDAERAADLYVEQGVQQPPGRPPAVGRRAILESYQTVFANGGLTLRMEPWQTVVSGHEARERGAYLLAAGNQPLLMGKYILVAERSADGDWRCVWSSVTPD